MPLLHKSGRKVGKRRAKPLGFTIPYYFYIYNISSNDSAAIQTARAKIYLFTMGTLYKIGSRILILTSTRQGIFPSNVPARSHSAEYVDQRTPALPKVMTDNGMLFICRELKKYVLRLKMSCDHTRRRFLMHDTMHTIIRTQNDSLERRLEQQERQCLGKVSYRLVG
jgi:hypothetical protein